MSKWISVEDRLPEENSTQYICYCTHDNGGDLVIALLYDDEWYETAKDIVNWNDFVTHWMPLPEPPNE